MASILYKKENGKVISERVNPLEVAGLLDKGWFGSKELADADDNETGKLSNDEIREAAKEAGIENWETARIATLKKKIANEQD